MNQDHDIDVANDVCEHEPSIEERIAAIRKRAHRAIALDGNLQDAVKGMNGVMSERNTSICAWGCRVVGNYGRIDDEARSVAVDAGGLDGVLRCLRLHPADLAVVKDGSTALRYLCALERVAKEATATGLLDQLAATYHDHWREPAVAQPILQAWALLAPQGCCPALVERGVAEQCMQAIRWFVKDKVPNAVMVSLDCVTALARAHGAARAEFARTEWIKLASELLGQYDKNPSVLTACLQATAAIAQHKPFRAVVARSSLPIPIVAALKRHQASMELCCAACECIAGLARHPAVRLLLQAQNVFETIIAVMKRHKGCSDLVLFACWALVELSSDDKEDSETDAEGEDGKTLYQKVTDAVLASLQSHRKSPDVQRYGTKAIENLARRSEADRIYVAQRNGVQTILLGLKPHTDKPVVLSNGFHALAVLASEDDEMHVHITQMRAVETAAKAMAQHPKHLGTHVNGARLLTNLAMNNLVRREIVNQGCSPLILNAVERFRDKSDLQYYAFRFLDNMGVEDDVRAQMQAQAVRSHVHRAMAHFHEDVDVLIAACRLLNRLAYDAKARPVEDARGVKCVARALIAHVDEEDLLTTATCALSSLLLHETNREAFMSSGLLPQVWSVLHASTLPDVAVYLCGMVSSLAYDNDASTQELHGLHAADWLVHQLESTRDAAIEARLAILAGLRNLSSNLQSHRRAVLNAKALKPVLQVLRTSLHHETTAFWCCAVLNNICREEDAAAEATECHEYCKQLTKAYAGASRVVHAATELRQRLPAETKRDRRTSDAR